MLEIVTGASAKKKKNS